MHLGLGRNEVKLVTYTPQWVEEFQRVKSKLVRDSGMYAERIQHIGSTAIVDMPSKPIIDLLIGVDDLTAPPRRLIKALNKSGFVKLQVEKPNEIIFAQFTDLTYQTKTHYVHVVQFNSELWKDLLFFRDYLNTELVERDEYARLKTSYVQTSSTGIKEYTDSKEKFVRRIYKKRHQLLPVYIMRLEEDEGFAEIKGNYACFTISPDADDYVLATKELLYHVLLHLNAFPVTVTFGFYEGQEAEFTQWFQDRKIDFQLRHSVIDQKKEGPRYKSPILEVHVHDAENLLACLDQFFWLPMQNEFFSVSSTRKVKYIERAPIRNSKRKVLTPVFDMLPDTTFITIEHDAQGVVIISNESKFQTLESLKKSLPKNIRVLDY